MIKSVTKIRLMLYWEFPFWTDSIVSISPKKFLGCDRCIARSSINFFWFDGELSDGYQTHSVNLVVSSNRGIALWKEMISLKIRYGLD